MGKKFKRLLLAAVCFILIMTLCACSEASALLETFTGGDSSEDTDVSQTEDIEDLVGGLVDEFTAGESDAGEAEEDGDYEDLATRVQSDTVYHNSFLGVTYTLPSGWWIYDLNMDNFSENPGDTSDEMSMDISKNDGYMFLYMIDCANIQYSNKSNHIGLYITAEKEDGIDTLDDFVTGNNDYLSENYGTMTETSSVTINGVDFGRSTFEIEQDGGDNYYILVFMCEVNEGYFLSFEASYWPDNTEAEDYILDMLETDLQIEAMV